LFAFNCGILPKYPTIEFEPTPSNNLTNQMIKFEKFEKIDDAVIVSFKMYSVTVKT